MNEPNFQQMPTPMSTFATAVDSVYNFIFTVSVVLFVGILSVALYFVIKYRRKPGVKAEPTGHNMLLELGWTVAPIFILAYMFNWGFRAYLDQAVAPVDAMEIRVRAAQWSWDFEYPNGMHKNFLKVPVGKPVKLVLSSADVIHSFYVPQFRIKKDAVPGMYTTLWFQATEEGPADVFCAEYCGGVGEGENATGHWSMNTKVEVVKPEAFQKFLDEEGGARPGETPADWGKRLSTEKACFGCHSLDGTKGAGPSWKGLYGRMETMTDGAQAKVDENYLRESMLQPAAKVVQGFAPIMPPYQGQLNDKEIDAIITFMKTVK